MNGKRILRMFDRRIAVTREAVAWRYLHTKSPARKDGRLPDFIVAGVMKCGTTSLFANLKRHPGIEITPHFIEQDPLGVTNRKEVGFFCNDDKWVRGVEWYRSLFNDNGKLQGDVSPDYLLRKVSIRRMYRVVPRAKMIVILRDPVTRAYSQFNTLKKLLSYVGNWEWAYLPNGTFDENIREEIRRKFREGMILRGFYVNFLGHLLAHYGRDRVLILVLERMQKDTQGTYDRIFDFLGAERCTIDSPIRRNRTNYEAPMSEWAKNTLYDIYRPYNEKLFKFLGYRIPEWEDLTLFDQHGGKDDIIDLRVAKMGGKE